MSRIAIGPHDVRPKSHRHYVGLDATVLRVAYGGERSQDAPFVNGSYGQDIVCIAGRGDFFPRLHACIAGTAHQYHAFVCNVGSLAGHQFMLSVQVAQA